MLSHAAGALLPELAAIVATHLEGCAACRDAVARAERVGGQLIEQQHPQPALEDRARQLRAAMLERLTARDPDGRITTVLGDMVDDLPDGPFDVVLVAYNTLFNKFKLEPAHPTR